MSLAVSGEQFPGSIQMGVLANTGENIEDLSPVRPGILHTVRGQDRQSIMCGKIDKLSVDALFAANEMALNFDKNILTSECLDQKLHAIFGLGSARVSRVGFGVAPKQFFEKFPTRCRFRASRKVRDGEDALASTRDACATQKRDQSLRELRQFIPLNRALPFFATQMRLGQ